jgi:hypothetical protein
MKEEKIQDLPIIFGFYNNNELIGFRSSTLNHISMNKPKIYLYTKNQVKIVMKNIKDSLNRGGTYLVNEINKRGIKLNIDINKIKESEDKLISKRDIEVRIHPFINGNILDYPEQWKIDNEIANLKEAIEVHKFTVLDNSN